jgi:hypothetical protein
MIFDNLHTTEIIIVLYLATSDALPSHSSFKTLSDMISPSIKSSLGTKTCKYLDVIESSSTATATSSRLLKKFTFLKIG